MELKHRDRIVQVKIVYYGPAVGGKTTNLQMLHSAAEKHHRGEFISVNSAQDRTILFDLLPLRGMGFHKFEIRFQLVAVPGQAQFAGTRRLVLRGADAVIFVANSAADRLEENVTSVREMAEHLAANGLDSATIPLVFQHNKRDLPKVVSAEELDNALNYREAPSLTAVAIRGEGVLETLGTAIEQTMEHLIGRYRSLALPPNETVQGWTWEMLHKVFGSPSIARKKAPEEPPSEEDRSRVRVSVPRPKAGSEAKPAEPAGGDGAPAALADRYAQASLELGQELEASREELALARQRLEELEFILGAIETMESGTSPNVALQNALSRVVAGGAGRAATLLGVAANRRFQLLASLGLKRDPILDSAEGSEIIRTQFAPARKPNLVEPARHAGLALAVELLDPPVRAIAVVPVRSSMGLHGLVLIYYGKTDVLPSPAVLSHLANMARLLAAWFSVRRASALSARATTAQRTLPQIESAAKAALVLLQEAARSPRHQGPSLAKVTRTLEAMVALTAELSKSGAPPGPPPSQEKPAG